MRSFLKNLILRREDCPGDLYFTSGFLDHFFPNEKSRILKEIKKEGYKCDCDILFGKINKSDGGEVPGS